MFFLHEALPTQFAGVRLFTSVISHVGIKIYFLTKTLSTLRAYKWLLSSVNSHVILKILFSGEALPTPFAGVRFSPV